MTRATAFFTLSLVVLLCLFNFHLSAHTPGATTIPELYAVRYTAQAQNLRTFTGTVSFKF